MHKIAFNLEIYTYHIDFVGHVNNSVYLQWMEIGRTKLLEAVGLPIHKIAKRGFLPVVAHTSITYKMPLYLGDAARLELWLSELRQASAIMNFRFYNGEDVLAVEAYQKGLFVDRQTKRPRRLQLDERELFNPYVVSKSDTTQLSNGSSLEL